MNTKKEKPPVVARDVLVEESYPGEAEETANEMLDDPYLFEAHEALKDELKKQRSNGEPGSGE